MGFKRLGMLTSLILVFVVTGYGIAESSCHTTYGLYKVSLIGRSVGDKIPKVIAFYTYKSKDVNPGAGRRLVFDVTKTNQGNGYNRHTGVFTFVAHVSKGDTVYVRNQSIYGGNGNIYSNKLGKTSFSGWLLQ
ncbi:uncharacterized protein LOC134716837 [Mytilus trossulus]|uniref:uncharacterized protein LOC134716837 n=1 Tax=Mytilus trossulus TaxID=6551 RepID=UPI0030068A4F